jgi:SOS-response transcriptional repressor LexA
VIEVRVVRAGRQGAEWSASSREVAKYLLGQGATGARLRDDTILVRPRQGKIVLVQLRDATDPETGQRYTVKRYQSEKVGNSEGTWQHAKITLKPINPQFEAVVLSGDDEGQLAVVAELVEVIGPPTVAEADPS